MDRTALAMHRSRLEKLLSRLRGDVAAINEQLSRASGGQAEGALSNQPMHLGDQGTDEFMHEMNSTLLENEQYLVKEARAALRRIDDGTYGKCDNCQKVIPQERLNALPFTRYCTPCAAMLNAGSNVNLNAGRPVRQNDVLSPADAGQP